MDTAKDRYGVVGNPAGVSERILIVSPEGNVPARPRRMTRSASYLSIGERRSQGQRLQSSCDWEGVFTQMHRNRSFVIGTACALGFASLLLGFVGLSAQSSIGNASLVVNGQRYAGTFAPLHVSHRLSVSLKHLVRAMHFTYAWDHHRLTIAAPGVKQTQTDFTTKEVLYYPSDSTVVAAKTGYCWTGSLASNRSDAYRCMSANDIYDPCFVDEGRTVLCPSDIPPRRGVLLRLTKPLPQGNKQLPGPAGPWAIQLRNGLHCGVVTGAGVGGFPFACAGRPVLYCKPVSAPVNGVRYTTCGPIQENTDEVKVTQKESVAVAWR